MKFKLWESKLCDRLNSWYKATEKDGQVLVSYCQTFHTTQLFLGCQQSSLRGVVGQWFSTQTVGGKILVFLEKAVDFYFPLTTQGYKYLWENHRFIMETLQFF